MTDNTQAYCNLSLSTKTFKVVWIYLQIAILTTKQQPQEECLIIDWSTHLLPVEIQGGAEPTNITRLSPNTRYYWQISLSHQSNVQKS